MEHVSLKLKSLLEADENERDLLRRFQASPYDAEVRQRLFSFCQRQNNLLSPIALTLYMQFEDAISTLLDSHVRDERSDIGAVATAINGGIADSSKRFHSLPEEITGIEGTMRSHILAWTRTLLQMDTVHQAHAVISRTSWPVPATIRNFALYRARDGYLLLEVRLTTVHGTSGWEGTRGLVDLFSIALHAPHLFQSLLFQPYRKSGFEPVWPLN